MLCRVAWWSILGMVALALAPVSASAQELSAFFSPVPNQTVIPAVGSPNRLASFRLRPNEENAVYLYVGNDGAAAKTATVVLLADTNRPGEPRIELARSPKPELFPMTSVVPVKLALKGKPGVKLPDGTNFYLKLIEDPEQRDGGKEIGPIKAQTVAPAELFTAKASTDAGNKLLKFEIGFPKKPTELLLSTAPAKVQLDLQTDINDYAADAIVSAVSPVVELPYDAKDGVTLYARAVNLKATAAEKTARVSLSIDGYRRAFEFTVNPIDNTVTAFDSDTKLNLRMVNPSQPWTEPIRMRPSGTVFLNLEGPLAGASLYVDRFSDDAALKGKFAEKLKTFPTNRDAQLMLDVNPETGAIVLRSRVSEWNYGYTIEDQTGTQVFELRKDADTLARTLILDRTPAKVELTDLKASLDGGSKVTLKAKVGTPISGIKDVWFYLGDAPSPTGTAAPGSRVAKGSLKDGNYEADAGFLLPSESSVVKFGVLVVSNVDLSSRSEKFVEVLGSVAPKKPSETKTDTTETKKPDEKPKDDKPAAALVPTTGTVVGRVMQSTRPQPDLPVDLLDATGTPVARTRTDAAGFFSFAGIAPGLYSTYSIKRIDMNAKGNSGQFQVEAGKSTNPEIRLFR